MPFRSMVHKKLDVEKHVFKTKAESEKFFRAFSDKIESKTIVLLQGAMGSGKSQTVKWLCQLDGTSSPSYALHHSYKNSNRTFEHFDLDRLEDEEDLESIGFWDIFAREKSIVLIEWPERVDVAQLPFNWKVTTIQIQSFDESEKREFVISNYAALS